jgi:protein KRI1
LPVRFKYKTVEAESYGLKTEEILTAEDKELNAVISLKKLAPYRSHEKQQRDMQKFKKFKKMRLWEFRSKRMQLNEKDEPKSRMDYYQK